MDEDTNQNSLVNEKSVMFRNQGLTSRKHIVDLLVVLNMKDKSICSDAYYLV